MQILALDTATKTGWATDGISGVQDFTPKRGESPGMRFLRFRAWLRELHKAMGRIDVIVYEQAHFRGGHATEVAVGFVTEVKTFAADIGAELMPVHSGSLKKFATGKGTASKHDMIRAAEKDLSAKPKDDNEADALWLYQYAVNELFPDAA